MKKNNTLSWLKKVLLRRQSLWSLGSNGVSALSGLIVFALCSSRLSTEDFGVWILFQTGSGLLDMFRTGLLLPGYLQQSAGKSNRIKSEIFSSVQYLFILITGAQVVICWSVFQWIPEGSSWMFFFRYYPMIILSGVLVTLCEWWYQSKVRFQNILLLRTINRLIILVFTFLIAYDLNSLIYVQLGAGVMTTVFILSFMKLPFFSRHSYKLHLGKLFNFGKYATPTQMASNLLRSSDALLISYSLGAGATGIYGAAAKFLEFVELPIRSLGAVVFNHWASLTNVNKHEEALRLAKSQIVNTTIRIIPIALILGVFAPLIIERIAGPDFSQSIPILRVMAVYCLLIPADRGCGLLLEASGRPDLNLLKVVVMLLTNIAGDIVAIYFFETPLAVACSSILTFLLGVGFGFWLVSVKAFPRHSQSVNLKLAME